MDLVTGLMNEGNAVHLTADFLEGRIRVIVRLLYFFLTEAALTGFQEVLGLFTGEAHMVGFLFALNAKVGAALRTPTSELGHVFSCCFRNRLSSVVLLSVIGPGWLKHDDTGALNAFEQIWGKLNSEFHLLAFNLVEFLR